MKRSPLIALAVTTSAPRATQPSHPMTYSPQVVLPFGDFINHLAGVAVDSKGNVYLNDGLHFRIVKPPAR